MTSSADLKALQLIADRSADGRSVPLRKIAGAHLGSATLRTLEHEGLLEIVDAGGEFSVKLTPAGRDVLEPRNSL